MGILYLNIIYILGLFYLTGILYLQYLICTILLSSCMLISSHQILPIFLGSRIRVIPVTFENHTLIKHCQFLCLWLLIQFCFSECAQTGSDLISDFRIRTVLHCLLLACHIIKSLEGKDPPFVPRQIKTTVLLSPFWN